MVVVLFFMFVFGVSIGSFLGVVMYRTIHDEPFVEGRSHCDYCGKQIAWFDNIPLLSYLLLRGKCRYCKRHIPITYPVIEFMTGALFVWWFAIGFTFFQLTQHPFTVLQPLFWLLVGLLFLVVFFTDYVYGIIPDYAVIALIVLGGLYRIGLGVFGLMQWKDVGLSVLSALGVFGVFLFLHWVTKGKGMGLGDVKFVFPLGLVLGWPKIYVAVLLACILGAGIGTAAVVAKKKQMKHTIPFGPFLVAGSVISLLWGEQLMNIYMRLLAL